MHYNPTERIPGASYEHTVRLTFAFEDYRQEMTVVFATARRFGLDAIKEAVRRAAYTLDSPENSRLVHLCLVLEKPGTALNSPPERLTVEDTEDFAEDWLAEMLIKAEIVDCVRYCTPTPEIGER